MQNRKETLLPTLRPGDIAVMDNMRSHRVKAVREILEAKGMKIRYLPPCSPDLNPVKKIWSKMNAILRCWKILSLYYFLIKSFKLGKGYGKINLGDENGRQISI